jgi:hypothetical protein
MRKRHTCIAAAVIGLVALFGSCQKDNTEAQLTTDFTAFSSKNTPSTKESLRTVSTTICGNHCTVLPFDGQNEWTLPVKITDNQFFTTKANDRRVEGLESQDAPIFSIFYFANDDSEQTLELTRSELTTRLQEVGFPETAVSKRVEKIFGSVECSPTFLAETAVMVAATLPPHYEGIYAAEVRKPTLSGQNRTIFYENSHRTAAVYGANSAANSDIKGVKLTLGVAGSLMTRGDSKAEIWLENGSFRRYDAQDIRAVLRQKRGDTEGDAVFVKLILGELTEQDVWTLFRREILPALVLNESERQLQQVYFRYNYIVFEGNTGRIGYTIYNMDGQKSTNNAQ